MDEIEIPSRDDSALSQEEICCVLSGMLWKARTPMAVRLPKLDSLEVQIDPERRPKKLFPAFDVWQQKAGGKKAVRAWVSELLNRVTPKEAGLLKKGISGFALAPKRVQEPSSEAFAEM